MQNIDEKRKNVQFSVGIFKYCQLVRISRFRVIQSETNENFIILQINCCIVYS